MLWEQLPALLVFLPGETCVGGLVWESYFAQKGREKNHPPGMYTASRWTEGRDTRRRAILLCLESMPATHSSTSGVFLSVAYPEELKFLAGGPPSCQEP